MFTQVAVVVQANFLLTTLHYGSIPGNAYTLAKEKWYHLNNLGKRIT
jgi:hypothetical protein